MKKVSFLDLQAINAWSRVELIEAASRVVDSGWYVLGQEVTRFEESYASFCKTEHCVGVANGLDALTLALRAMEIGEGDEVIVPSNTYIATWLSVSQVGATPVPVEPDEKSFNIDPERIEAAITPRTKAILPVHLYGQPAALGPIRALALRYDIAVLEDGAQAHGARCDGKRVGEGNSTVAWSFYPGKNLGALGDGGAVTCADPVLAERITIFRNYGSKVKYHNDVIGYNSRLDELQAAFLQVKLRRLDADNDRRRAIATKYISGLADTGLQIPHVPDWAEPVWHLFVIRHPDRDRFADRLLSAGVQTMIHYPIPPHRQPAYRDLGFGEGAFPISEAMHREVLSLPISPEMTEEDIATVIDAVSRLA